MGGSYAPERCLGIPVAKIMITALKDVRKPKANPTIPVHEEYGKLKRGLSDESANVLLVCWDPAPLRYNCTLGSFDGEVHRYWRILGWSA
jgi:hypothetical protein